MNKSLSTSGFSLIETLVSVAVLGAILLGTMTFMKKRTSEAKYLESVGEADSVINRARLYLLDKDACLNTLSDITIPSSSNTPVEISSIKDKMNKVVTGLSTSTNEKELIRIDKIELFNQSAISPDGYGQVEMRVHFLRNKTKAIGTENVLKKIYLSVATDASMKVKKCFNNTENAIETAYEMVCVDIGGEYSEATGLCDFYPLANGQHNYKQCLNGGGVVFNTGSEKICRSDSTGMPNNWTPFKNWSTTESRNPTDEDCTTSDTTVTAKNFSLIQSNPDLYQSFPATISDYGTCPTGSHSWSDQPVETCSYTCTETGSCPTGTCRVINKTHKAKVLERGYY